MSTHKIGLACSIPQLKAQTPENANGGMRGGQVEPSTIDDPELRAAFMAAHRAWASRYHPHLLERWLDD